MAYRDDRDALLARNDALEAENERLRDELDVAKQPEPEPARPAPPELEPARPKPAPPKPAPPKPRGRLHRPAWVIVLGVGMTAAYAFVAIELLATLVLGRDPLALPRGAWFPGCFVPLFVFGWAMSGRTVSRYSHAGRTPRWLNVALVVHGLYAIAMFVLLVTDTVAQVFGLQAVAAAFLAMGVAGTWYGEWRDR